MDGSKDARRQKTRLIAAEVQKRPTQPASASVSKQQQSRTRTRTRTNASMHVRTQAYTRVHAFTQASTHLTRTDACARASILARACTHANSTHPHAHTHASLYHTAPFNFVIFLRRCRQRKHHRALADRRHERARADDASVPSRALSSLREACVQVSLKIVAYTMKYASVGKWIDSL